MIARVRSRRCPAVHQATDLSRGPGRGGQPGTRKRNALELEIEQGPHGDRALRHRTTKAFSLAQNLANLIGCTLAVDQEGQRDWVRPRVECWCWLLAVPVRHQEVASHGAIAAHFKTNRRHHGRSEAFVRLQRFFSLVRPGPRCSPRYFLPVTGGRPTDPTIQQSGGTDVSCHHRWGRKTTGLQEPKFSRSPVAGKALELPPPRPLGSARPQVVCLGGAGRHPASLTAGRHCWGGGRDNDSAGAFLSGSFGARTGGSSAIHTRRRFSPARRSLLQSRGFLHGHARKPRIPVDRTEGDSAPPLLPLIKIIRVLRSESPMHSGAQ